MIKIGDLIKINQWASPTTTKQVIGMVVSLYTFSRNGTYYMTQVEHNIVPVHPSRIVGVVSESR